MNNKELIQKLKDLKEFEAAGQPQAEWMMSSREVLMSQIQPQNKENNEQAGEAVYYWQYFGSMFRQKILQPVAVFLLAVFVMTGYTVTASVADASLPGDVLYPIKTAGEKMQMVFTFAEDKKAQLQMNLASRRVGELQGLVEKYGNENVSAEDVSVTMQNIVENVKSVRDSLNKISVAAIGTDLIDIAKDIDTQTLIVEGEINKTRETLSVDVKKEAEMAIDETITAIGETGTAALIVIVKNFEGGDIDSITVNEVTTRVAERIKNVEEDIEIATTEVEETIVEETSLDINTTSTLKLIVEKPEQALLIIEEAKDFLDQSNFSLAIERIQASDFLIRSIEDEVYDIEINTEEVQEDSEQVVVGEDVATSTEMLDDAGEDPEVLE